MSETQKLAEQHLLAIISPFQGGHGESENGGQETAGSGVDEQGEGGAEGIIDEEPEEGGVNERGEGEADGTTNSGDEGIDTETTEGGGADEQGEGGAEGIIDEEPEGGGVNERGEGEADGTTDSGDEEIDAETTEGGGADEQGEGGGEGITCAAVEEKNILGKMELVSGVKLPLSKPILTEMEYLKK